MRIASALMWLTILVWALAALPKLNTYYRSERSNVREVVSALASMTNPGDTIYITPSWDAKVFLYYFIRNDAADRFPDVKQVVFTDFVAQAGNLEGNTYLAASFLTKADQNILADLGFYRVPIDNMTAYNSTYLYRSP